MKNTANLQMDLTLEGLGESITVKNNSLLIGDENNTEVTTVHLEDISALQNKELVSKLEQLQKTILEAHTELKELAIEAYHNKPMLEGSLEGVELEEVA